MSKDAFLAKIISRDTERGECRGETEVEEHKRVPAPMDGDEQTRKMLANSKGGTDTLVANAFLLKGRGMRRG